MRGHSNISGEDWRRDAIFIAISIVVIVATIIILVRSGLASARYESPKYPLYLVISELIYLSNYHLLALDLV